MATTNVNHAIGIAFLALTLVHCSHSCHSDNKDPPPSVVRSSQPPPPPSGNAPVVGSVTLSNYPNPSDLALPTGCAVQAIPQSLQLPQPSPNTHQKLHVTFVGNKLALGLLSQEKQIVAGGIHPTPGTPPRHALPWLYWEHPPVFSWEHQWHALVRQPGTNESHVFFWSEPSVFQFLASGDQLEAVDLRCTSTTCLALTRRALRSAAPGASVFFGKKQGTSYQFSRRDSEQSSGQPLKILSWDTEQATVALADKQQAIAVRVSKSEKEPEVHLAHTSIAFGLLDTGYKGNDFITLQHGSKRDELGCAPMGASLILTRGDKQVATIPLSSPAKRAELHALAQGWLLVWQAYVSCLHPQREVVYGLLLDDNLIPKGSTMPIADSQSFSVGVRGQDMWLFLDTSKGRIVVQGRCQP
jgi:hypothetical protein